MGGRNGEASTAAGRSLRVGGRLSRVRRASKLRVVRRRRELPLGDRRRSPRRRVRRRRVDLALRGLQRTRAAAAAAAAATAAAATAARVDGSVRDGPRLPVVCVPGGVWLVRADGELPVGRRRRGARRLLRRRRLDVALRCVRRSGGRVFEQRGLRELHRAARVRLVRRLRRLQHGDSGGPVEQRVPGGGVALDAGELRRVSAAERVPFRLTRGGEARFYRGGCAPT